MVLKRKEERDMKKEVYGEERRYSYYDKRWTSTSPTQSHHTHTHNTDTPHTHIACLVRS